MEEITTELMIPDEKEPFNFITYNPRPEKQDEDLWSPKKLVPYVGYSTEDACETPHYPSMRPAETFLVTVPRVRVMFELEQSVRVPVLLVKASFF